MDSTILQPRPTSLENLLIVIHIYIYKFLIVQFYSTMGGVSCQPLIKMCAVIVQSGGHMNIWFMCLSYSDIQPHRKILRIVSPHIFHTVRHATHTINRSNNRRFDTVNHNVLLSKIVRSTLPEAPCRWLSNYFKRQTISYKLQRCQVKGKDSPHWRTTRL